MATYILLRVDSPSEADRLVRDIQEHPQDDLLTPYFGDHVHAQVAGVFDHDPAGPAPAVVVPAQRGAAA